MGDASNLSNLNYSLPFNELDRTFQLFPDDLTAELKYEDSSSKLDSAKLEEMLVYNTTAHFVMIDNLQVLQLTFEDTAFSIQRKAVEEWYGGEDKLALLQNEQQWREVVQNKMKDREYVQKFNDQLVKRENVK